MSTLQEKIAVMQAFAEGENVEYRGIYSTDDYEWQDMPTPSWDWNSFEYRVKREPREWWINTYTTRQEVHDTKEDADDCAALTKARTRWQGMRTREA